MKKTVITFLILSISIASNAQDNIDLNLHTGVISSSNFKPFYVEGSVYKYVFGNIFAGIGLNYSDIDIEPNNGGPLTYDRKTFYYFFSTGNLFKVKNSKFSFSPQLKAGYATYSYSLTHIAVSLPLNPIKKLKTH